MNTNLFTPLLRASRIAALAVAFLGGAQAASAAVIDFDGVSTQFWISSYQEQGFDFQRTHDGMGRLAAGYSESYWRGNGTGRLLTWTNSGSQSGFTFASAAGDSFSLNGFDFANGYVRGNNAVSTVVLTGLLAGGGSVSETFSNGAAGWNSIALSDAWTGLTSVRFIANGSSNRAVWDNIRINELSAGSRLAQASGPDTIALAGLGLVGLIAAARRRAF